MPLWSCSGRARDGSKPVSQAAVYETLGRPLLLHALDGYNSTLMAYGQTGSGKTYTMMGGSDGRNEEGEEAGIIPRLCKDLFHELGNCSFTASTGERLSWEVHVRYVEVYCERISDLLNSGAPVSLREEVTQQTASFVLVGARRVQVESTEELLQALHFGNKYRRTAATRTNEQSSRSHAIFSIELTEVLSFEEPDGTVASATSKSVTIRLVDLAGSERVGETGVQGQQLKEAKDINLSLFTLGCVIECLSDPKRRSIKPPYRDSVLTKILRDAFGGNSKTTMVCTISPCEKQRSQTAQTLHYAAKARHVLNRPRVKEDPSALELRRANEELLALRRQLDEARRSGQHYDSIEAELRDAKERLHQEQNDARQRRKLMESREAELARRLRELEDQRVGHEQQMAALEREVENARQQQGTREAELRKAHTLAEEYAEKRLKELEDQRIDSETLLRRREEELLQKQHNIEEKLRETEAESRARIEEMHRRQKMLEKELNERLKMSSTQEEKLRELQQRTEDETRELELRMRAKDEEWAVQVRNLEATAKNRDAEAEARVKEALKRLQEAEEEAHVKGMELKRRRIEADEQGRHLREEMQKKEEELNRRLLDLHRQSNNRESELNERLSKAEYDLRRRERESLQHQEEAASLRQEAARQSASHREKERAIEDQNTLRLESLQAWEQRLKKREEELTQQFEELMSNRVEWEKRRQENQTKQQQEHDILLAQVRQRETELLKREGDLRQKVENDTALVRELDMQLQRQKVDFLAVKNEFEKQVQRDRRTLLRGKEELQSQQDRVEATHKLKDEQLREWELQLRERRVQMEHAQKEREEALRRQAATLAASQDAVVTKEMEQFQVAERLKREAAELQRRTRENEEERSRQHAQLVAELEERETELNKRRSGLNSAEESLRSKSRSCGDSLSTLRLSHEALSRREQNYFLAFESMYRVNIINEAEMELRCLVRQYRVEQRDLKRSDEILRESERLHQLRCELENTKSEQQATEVRAMTWRGQVAELQEEVDEERRLVMDLKVQLRSATQAARYAEEQVQQLRSSAYATEVGKRDLESKLQLQVVAMQESAVEKERQQKVLWGTALRLLVSLEEEQRCLIEGHQASDAQLIRMLESSHQCVVGRDRAIARWQSLYRRRNIEDAEAKSQIAAQNRFLEVEAQRLHDLERREEEVERRETGLIMEREVIEEHIVDFDNVRRSREAELARQEAEIQRYLLELEALDRAKTKQLTEWEQQLIAFASRLKEQRAQLKSDTQGAYESLLMQSAEQQSLLCDAHEELRRDSATRVQQLELVRERLLQAKNGDLNALEELINLQEAYLKAEKQQLRERTKRFEKEEARRLERLALQEEEIKKYLMEIEADDAHRGAFSQKGQELMREADARLSKAKNKEQAMRDLARALHIEALESEGESRAAEATLRRKERELNVAVQHRKTEIESRTNAANDEAESNERTLLELETDLRTIVNKNKDVEYAIESRNAELKRQKRYYLDLSKMLAERDEMLRLEHAHRMDGKRSAVRLTNELLSVNTQLQKLVNAWQEKFHILRNENKIECIKCSWKNKRDAVACRCCGDLSLLDTSFDPPMRENFGLRDDPLLRV